MGVVTVIVDNKIGMLAEISYVLGKARLNIENILVNVTGPKAIISMEFKNPRKAYEVLEESGFHCRVSDFARVSVREDEVIAITA